MGIAIADEGNSIRYSCTEDNSIADVVTTESSWVGLLTLVVFARSVDADFDIVWRAETSGLQGKTGVTAVYAAFITGPEIAITAYEAIRGRVDTYVGWRDS
ncbi:hypothetical protein BHYA_0018g00280 [Botrytis hyacinthi]|uniref:Uncharacterized protein n=1 Tax=Botrytis hyacinthi TaxID=278943 RepID=A0A4Z1H9F3_9HELO|nr:hypothetical protein BHYA_0018g00280 [Botrytis hyacinthi]